MNRLLKFLLWVAGLTVLLLITAHFTLRHALNTPKFKAAATGFIERTTGRPADYERIDYTLFPFSLVVRNAALKEPDGARDFAAMKEFSVQVDFRAKEITSIQLTEPAIRVVQHPDGSFNFSDLLAAPAPETEPAPPKPPARPPAPAPKQDPAAPAAPPLALRLLRIDKARFEFVKMAEAGREETFIVSDLDFELRDFAPDRPLRLTGRSAIGQKSSLAFELSGPPVADHAENFATWPVRFQARLDLRDFADLQAFLPPDTLPFQSLAATLDIQGALADKLTVLLHLKTSPATETHPVEMQAELQAELALPPPVAGHLFTGAALPEEWRFEPPPCTPPPGAIALTDEPSTALLLRHLQATATLAFPKIAYGLNQFTDGSAALQLRDGVLTLADARLRAYGGELQANARIELLACPLTYRLEPLTASNLAIEEALAANGLATPGQISGRIQFAGSLAGHAVAEPALRSLAADAQARIDDLQSVGTGGSLMDQVWLQLDNPVLLKLVPRLQPKVEQAKTAAATITTSRYETVTATLSLRDGTATLSDTRLALPDYRLDLAGTLQPFDDRLDLSARLVASPEETARLTDGKDRSAYLPYEDGGLMIPLAIRGSLQKPLVLPDLDRLLQNALTGGLVEELAPKLEKLADPGNKHVQEGLKLLQGLGTRRPK
jgi:hypothetical protein